MSTVIATITTSVDGYVAGPDDGPGCGLGVGGERLHYWVMGGPWTYETEHDPNGMTGVDKEFFDEVTANLGAGICGRGMYDAAGAWGGTNPFGGRQLFDGFQQDVDLEVVQVCSSPYATHTRYAVRR
jgi:hypothetical protein